MENSKISAKAKQFIKQDKRLSCDVALSEAILESVIISLDNKDKIPPEKVIDISEK